jgi:hypothetical protein
VVPRASAWAPRFYNHSAQRRNGQSIKRRTTSGSAVNGLGISIKYLLRTTSGPTGNGISRWKGLLICLFTSSALDSPCLVRASFASKHNSTSEGWGLGAQCLCVEPELPPCFHLKNPHEHTLPFSSAVKINIPRFKQKNRPASRKPVAPSPPSLRLTSLRQFPLL